MYVKENFFIFLPGSITVEKFASLSRILKKNIFLLSKHDSHSSVPHILARQVTLHNGLVDASRVDECERQAHACRPESVRLAKVKRHATNKKDLLYKISLYIHMYSSKKSTKLLF